jgi:hypothetical protein
VVSSTASLTHLNKDPTPDTKNNLKTTANQGVASLQLSGQGASSSSSSNILAVASTASAVTATNNRDKQKNPQGRRLLQQAALPTCQAVADLVQIVQGVGGLLAQTTDPATGPTSAGSSGLYVTAASLVGRSFDSQVLAVGTAMAPSSSGSAQDSLVASTAAASTNVRVSFSKPMAGTCTNTDDAGAAVTSQCVGAVVPVQLHLYESPEALLCSSPPASGSSRRLAGTSVTAADVALLSDAATLSVAGGSTLPCSFGGSTCSATLSFPLYATVTPNDPGVQCFKVEGGGLLQPAAADGWQLSAIAAAQDDPATQVAQCVVGAGGTYTIGRLRSVPAVTPAPAPAPTPAPAGQAPAPSNQVPQQGVREAVSTAATPASKSAPGCQVHAVTVAVALPISLESLSAQLPSYRETLVTSVAQAAQVPQSWVNVTDVTRGPTGSMATVVVTGKGYSYAKAVDMGTAVTGDPDSVFKAIRAAAGVTQPIKADVVSVEERVGCKTYALTMAVALPMSFAQLLAQLPLYSDMLVSSVAAAAQVPPTWVSVTDVKRDSMGAMVTITITAKGYSRQKVVDMGAAVTADPDSAFKAIRGAAGMTQPIRASVVSVEEHVSGPASPGTVGIAVGVAVAGVTVLVAGAALWCVIHRRRAQRVFPGGAQGAEVGHA